MFNKNYSDSICFDTLGTARCDTRNITFTSDVRRAKRSLMAFVGAQVGADFQA